MDCLKQIICGERTIIGVRDFEACNCPESDLFINDLPGISLKIASKITNEELHTGEELMKKCINIGTKKVFDDFSHKISPYFDFNAVVETRQVDDFTDATILPASNTERGLVLKRWRSELSQIYVEEIYVKVQTGGTFEIKIFDGTAEATLIENVVLESGVTKTIFIGKNYISEIVKIVMNNTVGVYSNSINNFSGYGCNSCNGGGSGFVVKGWNGSEEDSTLYGIGVKASVRCYEANLICSLLPRMYFFLWYAAGIEFLKERIYSDRLNSLTMLTRERAKELLEDYDIEYIKKYNVFSKNIYAYLRSLKGECLTCNGNRYAQIHP